MPRDVFRLAFRASMSAESQDTGELMLYGEIVQDYGKRYKENFPNDQSATDFDKAIKELKKNGAKKLRLRINSPGGIVNEAVAMRACLCGAGFDQIDIRIEGMCASAATILASIPDAHVSISPGSEYMIHNPWTLAWGNANEMMRVIDHLRQLEATSRAFYQQRSGQSEEQIKAWMDEEKWFTAEEAVEYGFADEVTKESGDALPAAACVTGREMDLMKNLYRMIPKEIAVKDEEKQEEPEPVPEPTLIPRGEQTEPAEETLSPGIQMVSHETSVAGDSTEIKNEEETQTMDIKELTAEQLLAENPALMASIQQAAVEADRQRQEDIDAVTPPTEKYRQMASEAKKNGTSAQDYFRQVVAEQKKDGAAYLAARRDETAKAQEVKGGNAGDMDKGEDDEITAFANEMSKFFSGGKNETMF